MKEGRLGGRKERRREKRGGRNNLRVQRHHQQGGEEHRVAGRAENYAPLFGSWTGEASVSVRSHPLRIPP